MADELDIGSDLTRQFAQLGDIKQVSARLSSRLAHISQLNHTAAGTDDEYATAYHKNVDANQQNLVDLVDGIGSLFDTTGENGQAVSKSFESVDDDAAAATGHMGIDGAHLPTGSVAPSVRLSEATTASTQRMLRTEATPALLRGETTAAPTQRALRIPATPLAPVSEGTPRQAERLMGRPITADVPAQPLLRTETTPAQPLLRTETTPAQPLLRTETTPVQPLLRTETTSARLRGETTTVPDDES